MENRSRNRRRAALYAASIEAGVSGHSKMHACGKGRLDHGPPIAVIDIGSNSVRLVVYEGLTRSPTPIFNEKVLAGLGREVQSTGLLARGRDREGARRAAPLPRAVRYVARATALGDRHRRLPRRAQRPRRSSRKPSASAAPRSTSFPGKREAHLSALGVVSGIHQPDGIVGDLGGGSLELVDVHGSRVRRRRDAAARRPGACRTSTGKSLKKAEKIRRGSLRRSRHVARGRGPHVLRGRRHLARAGAAAHVADRLSACMSCTATVSRRARRWNFRGLCIASIPRRCRRSRSSNAARRPLLAYAALVLENLVRAIKPKQVVISVLGVREGLLYSLLNARERARDPLIAAAADLNVLRSRSPRHGEELIGWTDRFMASSGLDESADERRLRHAACLLADIGWRAHPDYRGEQSMNIIAQRVLRRDRSSRPRVSRAGGVISVTPG